MPWTLFIIIIFFIIFLVVSWKIHRMLLTSARFAEPARPSTGDAGSRRGLPGPAGPGNRWRRRSSCNGSCTCSGTAGTSDAPSACWGSACAGWSRRPNPVRRPRGCPLRRLWLLPWCWVPPLVGATFCQKSKEKKYCFQAGNETTQVTLRRSCRCGNGTLSRASNTENKSIDGAKCLAVTIMRAKVKIRKEWKLMHTDFESHSKIRIRKRTFAAFLYLVRRAHLQAEGVWWHSTVVPTC